MKKSISILSAVLTGVLAIGALTACGGGQSQSESQSESQPQEEVVVRTTVTAEEWAAAFTLERFQNVTVEWCEIEGSPTATIKLTQEKAYWKLEDEVIVGTNSSGEGQGYMTSATLVSILGGYGAAFDYFAYDEENKQYTAAQGEDVGTLKFEDGYLTAFMIASGYMYFSDYGTTVIEENA
jgi:hypothetical protein